MLVYKDKCFCSAKECRNIRCSRHLNVSIFLGAEKAGLPIDMADFSTCCEKYVSNTEKICSECKHFIGAGDWNLCCDLKYGLTYEYTKACEHFEPKL